MHVHASCHGGGEKLEVLEGAKKIVLVGNPNVGKSVFFNALTGMYVDVSNFPGTTIEITQGKFGEDVLIDTPGVYGISSFNDEERVARDVVVEADIIVNIVDAVHLERDLFLTLQVIDMGIPVVVALNMVDEAKAQGIAVDSDLLSDLLGVEVIETVAVKKKGIEELKKAIPDARKGIIKADLQKKLNSYINRVGEQSEALLILEDDAYFAEKHGVDLGGQRENIYLARRERVNDIVKHVVKEVSAGSKFSTKLGRLMIRPLTGIPLLILTMFAFYELVGVFIAQTVVGVTEETIMQEKYEPFIRALVGKFISDHSVIGQILTGEFGLLTMTVTYLLGLLLPLVIGFYFFLSIMEDSGYLPRVATLVDQALVKIGLNGRAIVPIILGFGCVTAATITTRLLGSSRERLIAIFLLALAIPCSAQLGVIAALLGPLGVKFAVIYALIVIGVFAISGRILSKIIPGKSTDLLIDLPPIRLPKIENVVKKTTTKTWAFMQEAAPLFLLGSLIISVLQVTGALEYLQKVLAPLTVGWLQLPRETATAFIMGFVRRDFGAAGLYSMHLTAWQTVIALVIITLFVPCIAATTVIFKERSWKEAVLVWGGSFVTAFVVGGIISHIII